MGAYISKEDLDMLSSTFLRYDIKPKEIEMQPIKNNIPTNGFQLNNIKIGNRIVIFGNKSNIIREKIMTKYLEDNSLIVDIEENNSALETTHKLSFNNEKMILIKEIQYPRILSQFENYHYVFLFKYFLEYTILNFYKAFAKDCFISYDLFKNTIRNLDDEECIIIDKVTGKIFIHTLHMI